MKITDEKESVSRILCYIDSTIVAHNILIDWREADDRNAVWDESVVTDLTLIDDASRASDTMLLTLSPVGLWLLFTASSTLFLFAIVISKALNPSNSAGPRPVGLILEDLCFFFPGNFGVSEDLPASVLTDDSEFISVSTLSTQLSEQKLTTSLSLNNSSVIVDGLIQAHSKNLSSRAKY
jgi:hypothetical protein